MEDSIEKKTILLDSYNAKFNADNSFYFDLQEDIKNCIYIKTLKTEIHINDNQLGWQYEGENKYYHDNSNGYKDGQIRKGDHLYVSLNDFERIVVPVKIKTPYTNLNELITDLNLNMTNDELKNTFKYSDGTDILGGNTNLVLYNNNGKDILNKSNRAINYPIKNTTENFNKYYNTTNSL